MADRQDGLNASSQGTKRKDLGYWKAAMADIEAKTAAAAAVRTQKGEADSGRKARASSASTLTTPSKLFRHDAPIDSSRRGSGTFQLPPPTFGSVPLERLRSASAPTMPSTPPRNRDHAAGSTAPDTSTTALAGTTFRTAAPVATGGMSFGSQASAFAGQPTVSSGLGGPGFSSWVGGTAFSFGGGTAFGAGKGGGTSAPVASSAAAESSASSVVTGGQPQKEQQQAFAGIPPMPTSAPKPFQLSGTATSGTSTAAGGQPLKQQEQGFACIPPMPTSAPKPFQLSGTATSGASAAQPQKQQQQGFAGIPPMPTSAPKPFQLPGTAMSGTSAAAGGQPQKSQQQGFDGIPAMPTSAPKPFQLPGTKSSASLSFGSASSTPSFATTTPSAPASQFSFGGSGTAASFSGFSFGGGGGGGGGGGQGAGAGVAVQPQNQPPHGTLGQLKPFAPIAESGGFGAEEKVGGGGGGGGGDMQQPGKDQSQADAAAKKAEGLFGPVNAFGGSTFGASSGDGLFGAMATGSKTEDKASVAPAPTGGSSQGFGGIPPMPSSAPKPFSFSAAPTTTTTTANKATASATTSDKLTSGFSGIPPMPTSAPRSAKDLMSSTGSSQAVGGFTSSTSSSSATAATSSGVSGGLPSSSGGFSGIPPMPTSAPRPFSSFTQPPAPAAPTGKQSSATPATVKAGASGATTSSAGKGVVPAAKGYAGIPPMAFTAPRSAKEVMAGSVKGGGATKGAADGAASSNAGSSSGESAGVASGGGSGGGSGFGAIPPMPTSAPKPSPLSLAQAPTPTTTPGTTTGSSAATGTSAKGSAGFAGIPPMPTSAPKPSPFAPPPAPPTSTTSAGSSAGSGASVKGSSGFAGIPPMPTSAPRPLKEALATPSSSSSGPSSSAAAGGKGFSGIPPMSSVAPKPFSAVGLPSASGSDKGSVGSSKGPQAGTTIFTPSASTSATPFKSVFGTSTPAFGQTTSLGFSTPSDKSAGPPSGFGRQATPSTPFAPASSSPASTSSPTGAFSGFASRSPGGAASGSIFQSALGGGASTTTTTFGGSAPFTGGLLSSSTSFAQGAAKPSFNFGAPSPEAFKPTLFSAAAVPVSKPVVGSGRRRVLNVDEETDSDEDDEESVSTTEGEEDNSDDSDAEEGEDERGAGSAVAVRGPLESLAVGCMAPKPSAVKTQGALGGGREGEVKMQSADAASSSSWQTLMGGAAKEEVEVGEAEFLGAGGGAYGGDDDDDEDDEDAKEEERAAAVRVFDEVAGGRAVMDFNAFDDLLVRMKVHKSDRGKRKLFDSLAEGEGADEGVTRNAWAAWYVDYLFGDENEEVGDDEDDSEEEEGEERREAQESSSAPLSGGGGWDELRAQLGQDKGWSCSVCMTRNTDEAADKCVACEASRDGKAAPAAPKLKVTEASLPDAFKPASGKAATSSVFSFGGGVGSGGFSFGAPSTTTAASTTTGGFSFNSTSSATPTVPSTTSSSGQQPATTGLTFTGPATGCFSFGAPLSQPPYVPSSSATAATGTVRGSAEAVEALEGTSAGKVPDRTAEADLTKPSASISRQEDQGNDARGSDPASSWPTLTGGAAKEEVEVGEAEFLGAEGGAYGGDEDDEDMEAQREEERLEAVAAFEEVAKGRAKLDLKEFVEVLDLKNVYVGGDKSNAKLFERLAEGDGADRGVASGSWSAWYVDYVLNEDEEGDGDDGDDDEGDEGRDDAAEKVEGHEPRSESAAGGASDGGDAGWGALRAQLGQDKGWRCSVCMTRNTDDAADKCVACESSRDGKAVAKPKVTEGSLPPAFRSTAGSTTSASSFFSNASKGGGISGGGFSFGAPSTTPGSASSFFGSSPTTSAPAASTTPSAHQTQSTGFTFNAPAVGFSFGAPQPPAPLRTSSQADKAQEEPPAVVGVGAGDGRGDAADLGAAGGDGADETTDLRGDVVKFEGASEELSSPSWPTLTGGAAKEEVEVGEAEFLGAEGGAYGGDDDDDADLEAEKEEERAHAVSVFNEVANGRAVLDMDGFGKLLEKMSVHKTEKSKKHLFEQLSKDDGGDRGVDSDLWGQWYADFVTGDIDDDDEEGDDEGVTEREREADAGAGGGDGDAAPQAGWGELRAKLGQDKGWSCRVCMTRNTDETADKCVACESSRDGKAPGAPTAKPTVTEASLPEAFRSSGPAINATLPFSGTSRGGIGSGGFTFGGSGAASTTAPVTGASTINNAPLTATASQPVSGGFTFAAPQHGFSFGALKAEASSASLSQEPTKPAHPVSAAAEKGERSGGAVNSAAPGAAELERGARPDDTQDGQSGEGLSTADVEASSSWPTLTGGAAKEEVQVGEAEFLGAEGGTYDDDGEDDDDDAKEEERADAVRCYSEVANGRAVLDLEGFKELLDRASVYKPAASLFKQLADGEGAERGVRCGRWAEWYVAFVFAEEEEEEEEGSEGGDGGGETVKCGEGQGEREGDATDKGWDELRAKLGQDKGWSCSVCMTRNTDEAADKCIACEASRDGKAALAPAAKPKVTKDTLPPAFRPAGGGGSSSLFFSTSVPQGGIGSGGFSFGTGTTTQSTQTGFSLSTPSCTHPSQFTAPPAPSHTTPSGFSFTALAPAIPTIPHTASTKSVASIAAPTTGFSYSSSTTNTSPSPTCHPLAGLISEVPSSMATASSSSSSSSSSSADSTPAKPSVMTQDLQLEVPSDAASSASPSIDVDHDVQTSSPSRQDPGADPSAPSPTFPHPHGSSLSHDFAHEAYTHDDTHDGGEKNRGTNTSTPEGWVHAGVDGDVGETDERPQSVSPVVIDAPELLELAGEGFVDVGGDGADGEEGNLFPLTPPKPLDGDSSSGGDSGSRPGRDGMGGLLTPPQPALVQMPSAIRVSDKRRRAEWAFDELDRERTGRLPTGAFNELLAMLSLTYPTAIKPRVIDHCRNVEEGGEDYLCKRKFIEWYLNAADDDDDEFGFGRYTPFKLDTH